MRSIRWLHYYWLLVFFCQQFDIHSVLYCFAVVKSHAGVTLLHIASRKSMNVGGETMTTHGGHTLANASLEICISNDPQNAKENSDVHQAYKLLSDVLTKKKHSQKTIKPSPVPSGATYLAQLMAHDLILTVPSGLAHKPFHNLIRRPLMFDTIYGNGPLSHPHLYKTGGSTGRFRSKFALRSIEGTGAPDFWRVRNRTEQAWKYDSIIADRRNDSHTIIAQMTAIWMEFHNHVVDQLDELGVVRVGVDGDEKQELLFHAAQSVVRRTWHNVLRNDVFPFILSESYRVPSSSPETQKMQSFSSEFPSAAARVAFRCLHSLPLPTYLFAADGDHKELEHIQRISAENNLIHELDDTWAIDWKLFFDTRFGRATNRTRYETNFAVGLVDRSGKEHIFSADTARHLKILLPEEDGAVSLAAASATVDGETMSAILEQYRESIAAHVSSGIWTKETDQVLINNPPLQLILLHEAELESGGEHLGAKGSALLAPWLLGALATAESSISVDCQLDQFAKQTFTAILEELNHV